MFYVLVGFVLWAAANGKLLDWTALLGSKKK